jgi:chromosome segregation ATPase
MESKYKIISLSLVCSLGVYTNMLHGAPEKGQRVRNEERAQPSEGVFSRIWSNIRGLGSKGQKQVPTSQNNIKSEEQMRTLPEPGSAKSEEHFRKLKQQIEQLKQENIKLKEENAHLRNTLKAKNTELNLENAAIKEENVERRTFKENNKKARDGDGTIEKKNAPQRQGIRRISSERLQGMMPIIPKVEAENGDIEKKNAPQRQVPGKLSPERLKGVKVITPDPTSLEQAMKKAAENGDGTGDQRPRTREERMEKMRQLGILQRVMPAEPGEGNT